MNSPHNIPAARLEDKLQARIVCCVLGLGSLVAWNSIVTIADYYYKVFPDYHPSRVLPLVYQPFAVGTTMIFAYNEAKINTRKRNLLGYILFTISTLLLIVLDLATKGKGGRGPYVALCALVACSGVANAHVQGGMVGELSFMCPEFIQSHLGGLGVAGALTSGLRLITKAVFEKSLDGLRKGALLFLAISTFIEFFCFILYAYVFPRLPTVKCYHAKAGAEGAKIVSADLAAEGQVAEVNVSNIQRLSNKQLLRQNADQTINLFLIYVLTLSIFPGFLFENTGEHQLGSWYPLVLIALYNAWDTVSICIPLIKCLTLKSRKWITVCVLARFLLVPAFYFAKKYAGQGWMIFLTSFLGLTNGYLSVCILSIAPKGYNGPEANALGNLLTVFMLGGIFAGVCLDWLWQL